MVHDAGDDLLRGLSGVLSRHMRKRGTLARLGGDEFAVPATARRVTRLTRTRGEDHRIQF